jgi:hypothetical protein
MFERRGLSGLIGVFPYTSAKLWVLNIGPLWNH